MEEYSYTSTHPLDHTGSVTGSLYLYPCSFRISCPISFKFGVGRLHVMSLLSSEFLGSAGESPRYLTT